MLTSRMAEITIFASVSFAKTPVSEVSDRAGRITALGWVERGRGDPWAVSYRKDFPEEDANDPEAELRDVMGEYWLSAAEIRALLGKNS